MYSPGHPDLWVVTWGVCLNIQERVAKRVGPRWIAEQKKKKFEGQAAAEKYVQGRIAAYAHLFTELSPPVPEDKVWLFRINGYLLPGYTIAPHEPTPDELLAFVNEQDIGGADMFKKPPVRKETGKPKRGKAR